MFSNFSIRAPHNLQFTPPYTSIFSQLVLTVQPLTLVDMRPSLPWHVSNATYQHFYHFTLLQDPSLPNCSLTLLYDSISVILLSLPLASESASSSTTTSASISESAPRHFSSHTHQRAPSQHHSSSHSQPHMHPNLRFYALSYLQIHPLLHANPSFSTLPSVPFLFSFRFSFSPVSISTTASTSLWKLFHHYFQTFSQPDCFLTWNCWHLFLFEQYWCVSTCWSIQHVMIVNDFNSFI